MASTQYGMRLTGVAGYAPPTILTNDDIAQRLQAERERYASELDRALTADEAKLFETSDRWIRRFIGFESRREAGPGEGSSDLGLTAARLLLKGLHLAPGDIDGVIVATVFPSYRHSPPDSALIAHGLGIPTWIGGRPRETLGLDVALACCSWAAGLHLVYRHLADAERILLIGADRMTSTINWRDRSFACVLGDAGTATLCQRVDVTDDWFHDRSFVSWLDGSNDMVIHSPVGGSRNPDITPKDLARYRHRLTMNGARVREDMVPFISGPALDLALGKAGVRLSELDLLVLHEANLVLNREILARLRQRGFAGQMLDAGGKFGNTTSASIPLALALNGEELKVGRTIALVGFGGGYSLRVAVGTIRHPIRTFTSV